jgi:very-short-patch-repair endonuclease
MQRFRGCQKARPEKFRFASRMRREPTPTEDRLWQAVRRKALGHRVHRQSVILGYIADFYCPAAALVIEVDGDSHADRREWDETRDRAMASIGIATLRIDSKEITDSLDDVVRRLHREVQDRARPARRAAS